MNKTQKGYLVILGGVLLTLAGLGWDGVIHSQEHSHLVVEALLNPSNLFENPAHALIGIGLVWTTLATLIAFTMSWLEGTSWRNHWRALTIPATLWLITGVGGVLALMTLAYTP